MKIHVKLSFVLLIASLISSSVFAKKTPFWRPKKGTVALTFDDGPNPKDTPQILNILERKNIKATFFVLGSFAKKNPKIIHRMVADGDAVANHSMWHPNLTKISQKKLRYQIVESDRVISKIVGKKLTCLRPPFGAVNARVRAMAKSAGMRTVPIGYNTFDYNRPGAHKITSNVMKGFNRGRRIFLLHDGPKRREQTIKALPSIIKKIREKGYGFSAICYPK